MSKETIETPEELKQLYLNTNIEDIAAVQSASKEISENVKVAGKEKYLEALNNAIPATISKAQKYQKLAGSGDTKASILKNFGWIIMAVFAIWIGILDWDADATLQSLGFWIGAGVQIYIAILKSAWDKLTLSGTIIHPVVKNTQSSTK